MEYARTLLTKLESDALNIKIHTRRQSTQADLNRKRDIFEQISERLRELEEISIDSDEDSSDGEDLLGDIQTPSESLDSTSSERPSHAWGDTEDTTDEHRGDELEGDSYADESTVVPESTRIRREAEANGSRGSEEAAPQVTSVPAAEQAATSTQQSLRARGAPAQAADDTGETTARSLLFGNQPLSATTALSTTATTEAILDHQRAEQDKLTESLLHMASALKAQSHAFHNDLEQEKDIVSAAGKGMEKGELSMEAASRRMGALRRITEGKGWWGRMMLYAWIFGLMVVAVLIVGVLPKLRF